MRIGILKAGKLSIDLERQFGSYSQMIRDALGANYLYREFDVHVGELPEPSSACDGYVITGSSSSAYDPDPWIACLTDWLRSLDPAKPLVGICFGHQVMAKAYGGQVMKAAQGAAVGLHRYQVIARSDWMDDTNEIVIPVVHYDQIVEPPTEARAIARSDFCPYAALAYTDRRAVSFQGHPEFSRELAALAIERWLHKGVISPNQAEAARSSLCLPENRSSIMDWIRRFLDGESK